MPPAHLQRTQAALSQAVMIASEVLQNLVTLGRSWPASLHWLPLPSSSPPFDCSSLLCKCLKLLKYLVQHHLVIYREVWEEYDIYILYMRCVLEETTKQCPQLSMWLTSGCPQFISVINAHVFIFQIEVHCSQHGRMTNIYLCIGLLAYILILLWLEDMSLPHTYKYIGCC